MNYKKSNIKIRKYYIDWIRIILIASVFLFHIGKIFNASNWSIKNDVQIGELNIIMSLTSIWRMPLLFLISGVGTFYAVKIKNSGQYLKERFIRIFMPFIIGVFTLIPIQVYYEKIDEYDSIFHFYANIFHGIYPTGNFSWQHHLWFLLYLFLISLIISPFLKYFKTQSFLIFKYYSTSILSKKLRLNWIALILILTQYILQFSIGENTIFGSIDLIKFANYFIFFIAGFILMTDEDLIENIEKQRFLYLSQTLLVTAIYLASKYFNYNSNIIEISKIIISWSFGITVLGFAKFYLNTDTKYRAYFNEAIYPFYLLQQPVIIVVGYYIIQLEIPILLKMISVIFISLLVIVILYLLIIYPYNIIRFAFGLKPIKKKKNQLDFSKETEIIGNSLLTK